MTRPPLKYISLFAFLILLSVVCSGFLVGRTNKLAEEGKFQQLEQVRDGVVTSVTILNRGVAVIKRVMLR